MRSVEPWVMMVRLMVAVMALSISRRWACSLYRAAEISRIGQRPHRLVDRIAQYSQYGNRLRSGRTSTGRKTTKRPGIITTSCIIGDNRRHGNRHIAINKCSMMPTQIEQAVRPLVTNSSPERGRQIPLYTRVSAVFAL